MRLFIAIKVPEKVKEYISLVQQQIISPEDKIRFVRKDQMHLTLKFLGEVQLDKAEQIKNKLKEVKFEPFSVNISSMGVFPSDSYIRVVWVGLKPEDKIIELQQNIDGQLKNLFKKEKSFKAHLTLARVKFIKDKDMFIKKIKSIKIEVKKFEVNNFKLIKSTLTPEGPIYEELESFG